MANEAQLRDRFSDPIDFTWWNDALGATKGTILRLSGSRVVAAATADNHPFIGILARDKIANDGRTQVSVYTDGIFDMYFDSDTVLAAGSEVTLSGANILKIYSTLDDEKGYVVGKILEAGATGYCQVMIGRGH